MSIRNGIIFALLFFSLCLSCSADQGRDGNVLRVGGFPLEPIIFEDDHGRTKGLYPALLNEIAKQENWIITYVNASFAESLEKLYQGEIDLMSPIAYSDKRARKLAFSKEPVMEIWGQVFCRPGSKIATILDLKDRTVGIMKDDINGSNFIKTTDNFNIQCQIVEFASHKDIFNAVKNNEIFAGVAPHHFGLRHMGRYDMVATTIQFSPFPIFFATLKGQDKDLLEVIDGYLRQWKKDKSSIYYKELGHWINSTTPLQMIPKWLWLFFAGAAVLSLMLFFFNRLLHNQIRKKTNALKESRAQYKELIESANTVILRWDTNATVVYINTFGLNLFRATQETAIGKNILDLIQLKKGLPHHEIKEMVSQILSQPEKYALVETEHQIDPSETLFIQWSNKAITDAKGNLKEILSVGTDISRSKYLEKHLVNAQKMEAIGTLAGGIAHDFNNILTVITGNAELAFVNLKANRDIFSNLDRILNAAHRAKELTGQILAFSRESNPEKMPLNLADITGEVLSMLRATLPTTITISSSIDCPKLILANSTQIHQVLLNLCTNAFHAMEADGGRLSISIYPISFSKDMLYPDGMNILAGEYLAMDIKDTGTGIAPDLLPKIFEPYFTTKKADKGTGMGLAVVHGIIHDHGGYIRVVSKAGKGTCFSIYLPVAEGMHIEVKEEKTETAAGGDETIMIVDDEKSITDAFVKMLTNAGYSADGFVSSTAALTAFTSDPERYHLVLTDMTMPDMTGLQLTSKLRTIRPDIPFIICTGYNEPETRNKILSIGASGYLNKPVLRKELLKTIRHVLDS